MKINKNLLSALAITLITAGLSVNSYAQSARHTSQQTPTRTSTSTRTTTTETKQKANNSTNNNSQAEARPAPNTKPAPNVKPTQNTKPTPNNKKAPNSNGYHNNGSSAVVIHGAPRSVEPRYPDFHKRHNGHKQVITDPAILHHYMRNHPMPPCRAFALHELRVGNVFSELPIGYKYININGEWLFSALGYLFRPIMIDGQILFTIIG